MKLNAPLCSYLYTDVVFRALLLGLASNLNVKDVSLDLSCCEVRPDFSLESGNLLILFNEHVRGNCGCHLWIIIKNCSRLFHITGRLFMQHSIWIYSGTFRASVSENWHSLTFQCRLGLLKMFHCPQVWPVSEHVCNWCKCNHREVQGRCIGMYSSVQTAGDGGCQADGGF